MKLLNKSEYNLMYEDVTLKIGEEKKINDKIAKKFLCYEGVIKLAKDIKEDKE